MVESESDVTVDNQRRLTKNEKRRLKKKQTADSNIKKTFGVSIAINRTNLQLEEDDVEVEYVGASLTDIAGIDKKILDELLGVFSKFTKPEELLNKKNDEISTSASRSLDNVEHAGDGELATESANESTKLSKKKKKLMSRLSIAELKQLVPRPDVVEAHDVSSSDPRLLVFLKAYRNTVPVPRHWCHIRKYLQGKRGSEKIPYQLPEFIADTGIAKIREAIMEQEEMKKAKQKARERIRPKMGKIDIDYQVLHDAFFKFQTKPKMSIHGDLYYEGKEFEVYIVYFSLACMVFFYIYSE
jgi:splicing factor 3B subunit 2